MIVTKIRVFPLILNLKCGKLLASLNHPNGLCGMSASQISVSTPEVLWHGGGNENGKPDPVYSVDFHPQEHIMCTSGIDANVPPKGSVRVSNIMIALVL